MQRAVVVGAVVVVACATPYQQMGVLGGYEDRSIGGRRHIVTVKVNASTDRGTALEYLHRRAQELCPNGYEIVDRTSGNNGNVFDGTSKPELNAVVECSAEEWEKSAIPSRPRRAARDESEDDAEEPRAPAAHFFCSMSPTDSSIGQCSLSREKCIAAQGRIVERGADAGPCTEGAAASCFTFERTDSKRAARCAPTRGSCERLRVEKGSDGTLVSACVDVDADVAADRRIPSLPLESLTEPSEPTPEAPANGEGP